MDTIVLRDYSETIPYQYEDGKACFLGMDIAVDPRVFIPRPETELLVETTVSMCRAMGWEMPNILELGTGSGIIPLGLTKMMPFSNVFAADISRGALDVARENVEKHGKEGRVHLVRSDMFSAFGEEHLGSFDVIVSNPPYISHADLDKLDAWVKAEPQIALNGGPDGLDYYRTILSRGPLYLKKRGFIAVEVGYDQGRAVRDMFSLAGLSDVRGFFDMNGYERVVTGWKNG
ncbi:MAG: peptide chain release factor N(5)-glutamine methyltransferase [Candidatus Omnitrophica bacterium]|nr:peptide chain release factor N(5)-glutamine methyltransferase [Candidatus Omnitrophota bacterium]